MPFPPRQGVKGLRRKRPLARHIVQQRRQLLLRHLLCHPQLRQRQQVIQQNIAQIHIYFHLLKNNQERLSPPMAQSLLDDPEWYLKQRGVTAVSPFLLARRVAADKRSAPLAFPSAMQQQAQQQAQQQQQLFSIDSQTLLLGVSLLNSFLLLLLLLKK